LFTFPGNYAEIDRRKKMHLAGFQRMEARRQHELFHSREAIEARREEKRRLKWQARAERFAGKKEGDRLWFQQHPPN
jgi:hypothetical protein